jgi:50S ribosomal protein L16 3-hydroxylase
MPGIVLPRLGRSAAKPASYTGRMPAKQPAKSVANPSRKPVSARAARSATHAPADAGAALGGLSPAQFMREFFHRKPLLIRQAIPGFTAPVDAQRIAELAARPDVESRLITNFDGQWQLKRGPIKRLPPTSKPDWTVLVQGVNLHEDAAHALMQRFSFIERLRMDDLMISLASTGGGVGPHFDSYDVFLLQGAGRRRWRISSQKDLTLVDGLPLKILAKFKPTDEFVLEPGDMLYLPPSVAHEGVALDDGCLTYSIGFRTSTHQDALAEFYEKFAESLDIPGRFSNLQTEPTRTPGRLPEQLVADLAALVDQHRPTREDLVLWLGESLTEPKPTTPFTPQPGSLEKGLRLARQTVASYSGRWFFMNGLSWEVSGGDAKLLRHLADTSALDATQWRSASSALQDQFNYWQEIGWIQPLPSAASLAAPQVTVQAASPSRARRTG